MPRTTTRQAEPELESKIEARFNASVRALGGYTIKLAPLQRGIPDRLVMLPGGRMYLVELKTITGRLSPMQRHWHEEVRRRTDITVVVLYGMAETRAWLADRAEESVL